MKYLFGFIFILVMLASTFVLYSRYVLNQDIIDTNQPVTVTDSNITLPTSSSELIKVDNFLRKPGVVKDEYNDTSYFLGNTFTRATDSGSQPSYVIVFDAQTKFFNIALLGRPFAQSRLAAEAYLKDLLELDEEALCLLTYTVSVPGYVDVDASSVDYRFSFCPDAVAL